MSQQRICVGLAAGMIYLILHIILDCLPWHVAGHVLYDWGMTSQLLHEGFHANIISIIVRWEAHWLEGPFTCLHMIGIYVIYVIWSQSKPKLHLLCGSSCPYFVTYNVYINRCTSMEVFDQLPHKWMHFRNLHSRQVMVTDTVEWEMTRFWPSSICCRIDEK